MKTIGEIVDAVLPKMTPGNLIATSNEVKRIALSEYLQEYQEAGIENYKYKLKLQVQKYAELENVTHCLFNKIFNLIDTTEI